MKYVNSALRLKQQVNHFSLHQFHVNLKFPSPSKHHTSSPSFSIPRLFILPFPFSSLFLLSLLPSFLIHFPPLPSPSIFPFLHSSFLSPFPSPSLTYLPTYHAHLTHVCVTVQTVKKENWTYNLSHSLQSLLDHVLSS